MDDSVRIASTEELLSEAGWLRRVALRLTADADEASELEQETWRAALSRPPRGEARPWLKVVATNLGRRRRRDALARRYHEERAASDEAALAEDATLARLELQARVVAAVRALPEPLRTAVTLRHLDGLGYDEVARRTGSSEVAARKRVSRGLDELRRRLDRAYGGRAAWGVLAFALGRELPVPPSVAALATSGAAATAGAAGLLAGGVTMTVGAKLSLAAAAGVLVAGGLWFLSRGDADTARPARAGNDARRAALLAADEPGEPAGAALAAPAVGDARVAAEPAPPAPAEPDALVRGRVVDAGGAPVAGAAVELLRMQGEDFETLDLEFARAETRVAGARSDADGAFAFPGEPGRRYAVCASLDRDGGASLRAPAAWAFAGDEIVLRLEPAGVVAGQVLRPDELPAIGAEVVLRAGASAGAARVRVRTDADGTFRAAGLAPGPYQVGVASREGATPPAENVVVAPGAEARLVLRLERGFALTGRVTDARTGAPIAGARVSESWTFSKWVETDADGSFAYDYPREGYMELEVDADGYGRRSVEVMGMFDAGPGHESYDVELVPAATVRGRVVDAGGAPLEGVYVACASSAHEGGVQQTSWRSTRTGAGGRFRVEGVSTEMTCALFLVREGLAHAAYELGTPAGDRDVGDVAMRPGAAIAGRVVDAAGEPLAGHRVTLHGQTAERATRFGAPLSEDLDTYIAERDARTDARGRYTFLDVAPGDYRVQTTLPGLSTAESAPVAVGEEHCGGSVEADELVFSAELAISGRVLGLDGAGVGVVFVNAYGGEPRTRAGVVSGPDGAFRLFGLSPGLYTLEVAPLMTSGGVTFARVELDDVAAGTEGLEVRLAPAVELAGVVVDAGGAPVSGATVKMSTLEGLETWTHSDGDGRFAFTPPAGARVTLRAHPPGERSDPELPFQHDEDPARAATLSGVDPSAGEVVLRLPR